ncbi:SNF2-family ATP dependent chromatin remodeling factor snf21 [Mycena olivaceomarginata]|nr:SNF2-family ATP dependent chromatin remodeling factor snf21 [Mycena olivaceomarginata]
MEPQDLQALVKRANFLRNNPQEQQKTGELDSLIKHIQLLSSQGRVPGRQQQSLAADGHAVTFPDSAVSASQTPVSFTPDQVNALRAQIHAFKLITRGVPVPENIQQAIRVPEKLLQGSNVVVDNAVWEAKGEPVGGGDIDLPKGPFMEDDVTSGIYPYNAYKHPFIHLKQPAEVDPKRFATRLQRMIIPTIMPTGLDALHIVEERDRFIDARMQQRIRELEALESTIGHGGFDTSFDPQDIAGNHPSLPSLINSTSHGKIRALIELKSLHLLDKQRLLRAQVAETLTHGSLLPSNRPDFRRFRKPTLRDARVTEQLERKQRLDRERRARSKHVEQLAVIRDHARQVVSVNRAARDRVARLGRLVLDFHQVAEKEEQKRVERIAKERIQALKADDEEAYRVLVDNVKDTRITHLLRQTDAYLDSLAQAVAAQQNEGGRIDMRFEMEQGAATEATFGAQISAEDAKETSSGKTDYYAVAHRISEKITRQPSLLIGGTLKEYQLKGLQWMVSLYNNRLNGILADEMGLGKTIQAISLITFLIESKKLNGPYLVIVPLSTMANWSGEFAKWAPSLKVVAYMGNPAQRRALEGELRVGHFHVLLTTYEYIIKDRPILCKIKWLHMIIDEGHRMKNVESKLAVTLTTYYYSRYRLLLSGTPLQNNLTELWSLLNFVLPRIFNSAKSFDEWFNTPFANSGTGDKIALSEEEALLIIRRLHKVLRPFLLRRLKKDVVSELPDKVEKVVRVPMSVLQSQIYKQMKLHKMIADGSGKNGQQSGVKGLRNELMQLRKICQHPFVFESVEDKMNPGGLVDDKLIRNSGKIELLNRILPKLFAGGHRVLIFFQMTKVMDIMADFLTMMGWKFLRLDGVTKTEERANFVQLFNAKDSEYKVFILSTRAGGLGLNLQTADTVIIFDSDWNPHADLQAQDRAHRIGQTKTVLVLRFITEKSVEEAMHQRARYKLDIDHKVIQAGRFDDKSTPEEQENFLRSILEAEEAQANEEAGDMNDDELNSIIARNKAEAEMFRDMDTKREREALENWRAQGHHGKPPPPLTQFEELPECYQKDAPFEVALVDDVAEGRGQRRRTVVSYDDGFDDETWAMALEDGEVAQRNSKRGTNKLLRDAEAWGRGTPVSDSRARKGKSRMSAADYQPALGSKRKRGIESTSATPSVNEDDDRQPKRRKGTPKSNGDVAPAIREKMKNIFNECYRAVVALEDADGRKRCELFRELPDRHDYPNYYQLITQPIALSHLRKRASGAHYKDLQQYRKDWSLMFTNARTFNQEGSWVYVDAVEMEKVLDATFKRLAVGSGLPGALGGAGAGSSGSYQSVLTPMDEDDRPPPPSRRRSSTRRQVISDEE